MYDRVNVWNMYDPVNFWTMYDRVDSLYTSLVEMFDSSCILLFVIVAQVGDVRRCCLRCLQPLYDSEELAKTEAWLDDLPEDFDPLVLLDRSSGE